jgi:hypothetical protein
LFWNSKADCIYRTDSFGIRVSRAAIRYRRSRTGRLGPLRSLWLFRWRDRIGQPSGLGSAMEVNYGAAPNLQLHVMVAFAFDAPLKVARIRGRHLDWS